MKLFSIYKSMEESAELCPVNQNVKLILRHSIRQDIKEGANIEEIKNAQLTREGRKMSERMGESLNIEIGTVASSYSERCIDTCQEIINGYNKNHNEYSQEIIKTKMLQSPHLKNIPEELDTWKRLGSEGIFECFINNGDAPGFYDLETTVNRILDFVFETGNESKTIDIFCTHDFQIATLLLYFKGKTKEYKQALFSGDDTWPFMLEGLFLWGDRNNFNIVWRGEKIA